MSLVFITVATNCRVSSEFFRITKLYEAKVECCQNQEFLVFICLQEKYYEHFGIYLHDNLTRSSPF